MTGTTAQNKAIAASSSSGDYASRHQQKYQERIRKESELELIAADEALARSLQEKENLTHTDHIHATEIREHIQHPDDKEDTVRAPLRTGYTERLIGDDSDDSANRVRNPSRIWSMFSRRAISGSSESLLPTVSQTPSTLSRSWASFLKFLRAYYAVLIPVLLAVTFLMYYILTKSD